jgi:hypothetical protein
MIGGGKLNPNETVVVVECDVDADGALVPARASSKSTTPRNRHSQPSSPESPPPPLTASTSPPGHRGCVEMKRRVQSVLRVHC